MPQKKFYLGISPFFLIAPWNFDDFLLGVLVHYMYNEKVPLALRIVHEVLEILLSTSQ